MCTVWWGKKKIKIRIYFWSLLDKGSYLQALPELKFLACQQDYCERRSIIQTADCGEKKSRYIMSVFWAEYKTCINTTSEEVKVVLQSQMESEWVAVTIRKEICLLTKRTCPILGYILANIFLATFGKTSTFNMRFGWNCASWSAWGF